MRVPSLEWLPESYREQAKAQLGLPTAKQPKRPKYGNRKTVVDGITFDSKKESRRYELLKLQKHAGQIKGFVRQVRFDLPGGVGYVCDFLVFNLDGTVSVLDVKGISTKEFKIKRRLVRAEYGLEIEIV